MRKQVTFLFEVGVRNTVATSKHAGHSIIYSCYNTLSQAAILTKEREGLGLCEEG